MTDTKRPLKVFLCHAHADRDAVRTLYTRLTNDGVDAWLDKEKLLPGQDWELEIKKPCDAAMWWWSAFQTSSIKQGFRQKEVRLALDTAMEKPEMIFIIPARLEECDNLESLRKWHWVDLFEDDGFVMLKRRLRRRANNYFGATLQIKKGWLPKITSPIETTIKKNTSVRRKDQKCKLPLI
ncbi:MAG: toll/interleukin-1 receptor domain-containing protein [Anaerolineales bacterium]|nr:toll/interleukin-1 receptor domain-containing protein [Anaerolineales bacterium]